MLHFNIIFTVVDLFYIYFLFVGVPPLVSRRVLETLTYLARNHPYVAKILLQLRLPLSVQQEPKDSVDKRSGKAVTIVEENGQNKTENQEGYISTVLLLSLLNQPLYLRSISHLEQVKSCFWSFDYLLFFFLLLLFLKIPLIY